MISGHARVKLHPVNLQPVASFWCIKIQCLLLQSFAKLIKISLLLKILARANFICNTPAPPYCKQKRLSLAYALGKAQVTPDCKVNSVKPALLLLATRHLCCLHFLSLLTTCCQQDSLPEHFSGAAPASFPMSPHILLYCSLGSLFLRFICRLLAPSVKAQLQFT